jgi:hypothetical protein
MRAASRSRGAFFAPGVVSFLWPAPRSEGGAERRETRGCLRGTPGLLRGRPGACEAPAPPCDRGRSPLGAPPAFAEASAGMLLAIFGLGSAFPAPPFPAEHVQRAPRSTGRSARRAVSEPPEPVVQATAAGRQSPLHLQDCLRTAPLMSGNRRRHNIATIWAQEHNEKYFWRRFVAAKDRAARLHQGH